MIGHQYCIYCASCLYYDGKLECDKMEKPLTANQAQRMNHCPHFLLSPMGNAVTGKQYRTQKWKWIRNYDRKYNT